VSEAHAAGGGTAKNRPRKSESDGCKTLFYS
jgi:hypothetical protein